MKRILIFLFTAAVMLLPFTLLSFAACDHNWRIDYEQCVAATCSENGKNVYVCSRCSDKKTETVMATAHDFVKLSGEYATCEQDSTVIEKCSVCGLEKKDTTKAIGHDYEETARKDATCSKEGSVTYKCKNCGGVKTEAIKTVSHDFSKFVSSSATCTERGQSTYQCSMCDELTLKTVTSLGHDFEKSGGPTCTERGKYVNTCKRCGYTKNDTSYTKALGHDLPDEDSSSWRVVKSATCDEKGEKRAKCARCKQYVYEDIPKKDHDFDDSSYLLKAPTKTTTGRAEKVCANCDYSISKTIAKGTVDLAEYKVPSVTATKNSGTTLTRGTTVKLECELEGAEIYYALGSKNPTNKTYRKLYSEPLTIVDNTTVKAYAVYDGIIIDDSEVETFKYYIDSDEPWVYLNSYADEGGYMELEDGDKFRPDEYATRYEVVEVLDALYESWAEDADVTFADVDKSHRAAVRKLVGAKLLNGYDEVTFKGEANIKRGELCKVLALATGLPIDEDAELGFKDVAKTHWAYAYIAALTEAGYLAGDTDGNFRPEDNITRAELVVVINRIADVENGDGVEINDVKSNHWAYGYICGAVQRKSK